MSKKIEEVKGTFSERLHRADLLAVDSFKGGMGIDPVTGDVEVCLTVEGRILKQNGEDVPLPPLAVPIPHRIFEAMSRQFAAWDTPDTKENRAQLERLAAVNAEIRDKPRQ